MPFIPLTAEEKDKPLPFPCKSQEHYPPMNYLPTQPWKWICPMCWYETLIQQYTVTCNTWESWYKIICFTKLWKKMIRII